MIHTKPISTSEFLNYSGQSNQMHQTCDKKRRLLNNFITVVTSSQELGFHISSVSIKNSFWSVRGSQPHDPRNACPLAGLSVIFQLLDVNRLSVEVFMFKMFSSGALRIRKLCYPWVVTQNTG